MGAHDDFIVLHNAGYRAASIMNRYPTQSHYPDTELVQCHILLMSSARLGSDNYQFWMSLAPHDYVEQPCGNYTNFLLETQGGATSLPRQKGHVTTQ